MNVLSVLPRPIVAASIALLVAAGLSACGSGPRDPSADWTPEKLLQEAKAEAAAGNFEAATRLYERLEGRASGSVLAEQAQLERAYMLYRTNEKAQALSVVERFIKLHPTSPAIDYAYYLQGLINFNDNLGFLGSLAAQDLSERDQQAARDAYQSFKQLVELYPRSIYAEDSRLRMNYIVNMLAAYEVHVARYYFRRGAYLAAVNRAQQTVQEYQDSPSTEEALYIMVQSYDRLGLTELRDDAARVLQKNFPDSRFLVEGVTTTKRSWWRFW